MTARLIIGGSSPRMWGTPFCLSGVLADDRFIPTHVGNTVANRAPSSSVPVHPHACGEHLRVNYARQNGFGSSPRMWGTLVSDGFNTMCERFIPTHVGNTHLGSFLKRFPSVHPHACGEHLCSGDRKPRGTGSSPRMWGTLSPPSSTRPKQRFIPTHVGNT